MCFRAYCPVKKCGLYLGKKISLQDGSEYECGWIIDKKKVKFFITLSLEKQFKRFLDSPGSNALIQYHKVRQKRDPDSIEDIYDGVGFQRLIENGIIGNYDFPYILNTDGFQLSFSSMMSAWPLFIRFPGLRMNVKQKHIFLAGIWIENAEPNMTTFLEPFVIEANMLSSQGISWKSDGENRVRSRFIQACFSVDSPAHALVLNMTLYNRYYWCTFCDHTEIYASGSMKYPIRLHSDLLQLILQTHESFLQQMIEAHALNHEVHGVKGPAPLMNLNHFDLASGFVVDDLHAIYLGVVQFHIKLLFTNVEQDYYLNAESKRIIDNRLEQIKTPREISRKTRSITFKAQWKASEWRNWLLYFCIVFLKNLIPSKYILHLEMLAQAVFIFSQEAIMPPDIIQAARYLY